MPPLLGRPPSVSEVEQRVGELLAIAQSNPNFETEAVELAESTNRAQLMQRVPILRKLDDLHDGYINRALNITVADRYPALADEDVIELMDLDFVPADEVEDGGPISDFEPLNAVATFGVNEESIWFMLLAVPGVEPHEWPVVFCDPASSDESVYPIAIDLEHLIHETFTGSNGYHQAATNAHIDDELIEPLTGLVAEVFPVDGALYSRRVEADRDLRDIPGPKEHIGEAILAPLMRLAVPNEG